MSSLINKSIGRYHIIEQLGQGGMATVYKAYDTRLEREVAIKIIRKEAFPLEQLERVLQRFEREAKALAKMSHANIVKVHDFGDYEGSPYLVMELLSGGPLKQYTGTAMSFQEAVKTLEPIARALAYAHELGVLHRDVKPANILITQSGEPILTDFGIAKLLENDEGQTLTGTGIGVGTPEYMAPEQGLGKEIDGRADVYALGVVFYELVTGQKPFTADTPLAVLLKQVNDPLPRPIELAQNMPDEVEKVLFKALAKDPQDRYQGMDEFDKALQKLAAQSFSIKELNNKKISELQTKHFSKEKSPITNNDEKTRDDFVTPVQKIDDCKKSKSMGWLKWIGIGALAVSIIVGLVIALQRVGPIFPKYSADENNLQILQNVEEPQVTLSDIEVGSTKIREIDGMVQVYVPAGEFEMGSNEGNADEKPAHIVSQDSYWIDQTEVTNLMYATFLNDSRNQGINWADWIDSLDKDVQIEQEDDLWVVIPGKESFPVIQVTWEGSQAYCEWIGGRLPTEAEWEKAARGTDGRVYPWGDTLINNAGIVGDITVVGIYPDSASIYGVLDMGGNAWEWVSDWYDKDYYIKTSGLNPAGPIDGDVHVIRGGTRYVYAREARADSRTGYGYFADFSYDDVSFRCVKDE